MVTSTPRVPMNRQPLAELKARYPAAVAEVIDVRAIIDGLRLPPSAEPKHVFDTEDGLRLIISMERMPDGKVGTHISASLHDDHVQRLRERRLSLRETEAWVIATWQALSGSTLRPQLHGVTGGGVPHFFLERGN
jgi:hypothetical protein